MHSARSLGSVVPFLLLAAGIAAQTDGDGLYLKRVNCGGPAYTDSLGRAYVADQNYAPGAFGHVSGTTLTTTNPIARTSDDVLFQTMLSGNSFKYGFDVPTGKYQVSLYMTEPSMMTVNQRLFRVTAEGKILLDQFDLYLASGTPDPLMLVGVGTNMAYCQTFEVDVTDGKLIIEFNQQSGGPAIVSAIAVEQLPPAPKAGYDDVSNQVGISFVNQPRAGECAPPLGTGSAWADYDGDGLVDVYVTNHGGANALYRNLGDVTGDGLPDFMDFAAMAGVDDPNGTSHGCVFIDYDNDGDQDLYVLDLDGNTLFKNQLQETGSPIFLDVTAAAGVVDGGRGVTASWADFDQDGFLDFYLSKHFRCSGQTNTFDDRLYHNNGNGTFTDVSSWLCSGSPSCTSISHPTFSAGWFDYDNDGDLDLYLASDNILAMFQRNVLWRNDGPGTGGTWKFTDVSASSGTDTSANAMGLGVGDYDNDGFLDLAFSNVAPNNLLRNRGDGTFEDTSVMAGIQRAWTPSAEARPAGEAWSWGTTFLDHDNDGWLDVFYVCGHTDNLRPWIPPAFFGNNHDGTFRDLTVSSGLGKPMRGRNASVCDFDADGFPDLMVCNFPNAGSGPFGMPGEAWLYHNRAKTMGNGNHWLAITLEGTKSNRDAIGTRVTATMPTGASIIRELRSGCTHGGGDQRVLLFGVGEHTKVKLTVRWPNGTVQNSDFVKVDRYLHLVEP